MSNIKWSVYTSDAKMKLCGGPLHFNEGRGTFVPVEDFSPVDTKRRPHLLRSFCRECSRLDRNGVFPPGSYVPIELIQPVYVEIERRVGREEGSRRLGLSNPSPFRNVVLGRAKYVRRHNAMKAVQLLAQLRRDNVWYDARSIRRGATSRGEKTKPPTRIYKAGTLQRKGLKGEKHPNFKKKAA